MLLQGIIDVRTPHLLLFLRIRVHDAQQSRLVLLIALNVQELGYLEFQRPCASSCQRISQPSHLPSEEHTPKGPLIVIFFLKIFLYDVRSFFALGSPINSSTPGGIEMGVRPSFEGRFEVVEKCRGTANVCHAGTRNPGSVVADEAAMTFPNAVPRLGANMAAIDLSLLSRAGWVVCRRWYCLRKEALDFLTLSHDVTCGRGTATMALYQRTGPYSTSGNLGNCQFYDLSPWYLV